MIQLPTLPFAPESLSPLMSAETLETHHGKHHAGYVKKTNDALASASDQTLEEIVRSAAEKGDTRLFNNAAQAWNHGFFWNCLSARQSAPSADLRREIERRFNSFEAFSQEFIFKGEQHFASGWIWLVADSSGSVRLEDMHDAGTPLTSTDIIPLLVCDLWEHAYYLDHKNQRGAFLKTFIDRFTNWDFANAQYEAARKRGEGAWLYPA